jgi:hypothetical protein
MLHFPLQWEIMSSVCTAFRTQPDIYDRLALQASRLTSFADSSVPGRCHTLRWENGSTCHDAPSMYGF